MPAHFKNLFYPKSIAIIGASDTKGTVGYTLFENVSSSKYSGKVYPVNIKGGSIQGKKAYRKLSHLPHSVELVIIAVPAQFVPDVLEECGEGGVKAAVVISAGFSEIGKADLENELVRVAEKHDITLIGPNCLGFINAEVNLNASFANILPTAGKVAFLSQSGALCSTVLDYANQMGMGFSKFMSIGNKSMIGELEILEYLLTDDATKVIMLYVEELEQAQKLIEVARKITHGKHPKPILLLKSGRTAAGAAASQSHTGSLGGADAAYSALCAQSGIIRVDTIAELFSLAEAFSENRVIRDNNVAVITNAGGPGVLVTDEISSSGLKLAELSKKTLSTLRENLPASANIHNPIDVLGDARADRYQLALSAATADPNVDAIILILTPQAMTEIEKTAQIIAVHKRHSTKPLIVSFMGSDSVEAANDILNRAGVTTTDFPEPAAKSLGNMYRFRKWLRVSDLSGYRVRNTNPKAVSKLITKARSQGTTTLDVESSSRILEAYGFTTLKSAVLHSPEDAQKAQHTFRSPVVLKIISSQILHKSDVGGVLLSVEPQDIPNQYQHLLATVKKNKPHAHIEAVQVVEMMPPTGIDLIMGMTTDPQMGKLIAVGLGGIYTEILKDVSWGIAPLTHYDTKRMIQSLKSHPIFEGLRGQPPLDVDALRTELARLSQFALAFPEVKELDLNPVRVLPEGEGVVVLDARVLLKTSE